MDIGIRLDVKEFRVINREETRLNLDQILIFLAEVEVLKIWIFQVQLRILHVKQFPTKIWDAAI